MNHFIFYFIINKYIFLIKIFIHAFINIEINNFQKKIELERIDIFNNIRRNLKIEFLIKSLKK